MTTSKERDHFQNLFEYAPLALWEEDLSGVLGLLTALRGRGVKGLDAYLKETPTFLDDCLRELRVLRVNRQALALFKAKSLPDLVAHLEQVFEGGLHHQLRGKLLALWKGEAEWSGVGVATSLEGDKLDLQMHWCSLPGSGAASGLALMTIEDISGRVQAEQRLQNLFDAAPISLWEEDFRNLKERFDRLRRQGVTDLQPYLAEHPELITECMGLMRVLNVNQKTLDLFGAGSQEQLMANLGQVFRDEMKVHFAHELVDLWNGKTCYERDGINYTLSGEPLNIHLDFRLMPGHEQDFSWVLVALQDITARKKAEDYLRYLGVHDVLTGLYNRLFFEETLQKLEQERQEPISVLLADLNGLKRINDRQGHQAGDNFIRRAAEVIKAAFPEPNLAARIGGDEFAVFLPGADGQAAEQALEHLRALVQLNNKYYRGPDLSMSLGVATSQAGQPLEKVISLADNAMYRAKGEHYHRRKEDR